MTSYLLADFLRKRNVDVNTTLAIIGVSYIIIYLILLQYFSTIFKLGTVAITFICMIVLYAAEMWDLKRRLNRKPIVQ